MRVRSRLSSLLLVVSLLVPGALASRSFADVSLPHVFGSHMVVQRDMPVPVWGRAAPGEEVTVSLGDQKETTKADASGRWSVKLGKLGAGGPLTMTVSGKNTIKFEDVLIGEVWIGSGQSNMQFTVSQAVNGAKEAAAAEFPRIRFLSVPRIVAGEPADDAAIEWVVCSPKTAGGFSAVAYFFGRQLQHELDVPIGVIDASWGGSAIEPWTPRAGFEQVPSLKACVETIDKGHHEYLDLMGNYLDRLQEWLPTARKAIGDGVPPVVPDPPAHPLPALGLKTPSVMYNAMVSPLVPFAIRGAIWYQGENNTVSDDGMAYYEKMKALVGGWRKVWGQGEFPFYYVQIAPWQYGVKYPGAAERLPKIWEAQLASLSIPNTGMVVTTDIGDLKDIHPPNKQDVGKRLALWAMAGTYGRKEVVCSGPLYKSMSIEDGRIRIRFAHVGGGLVARDGKPLSWFQVAGEDRKFVNAKAEIDGETVVVSSDSVAKPVAARLGWNELAEPNLMNKEGLPASPFRTDR